MRSYYFGGAVLAIAVILTSFQNCSKKGAEDSAASVVSNANCADLNNCLAGLNNGAGAGGTTTTTTTTTSTGDTSTGTTTTTTGTTDTGSDDTTDNGTNGGSSAGSIDMSPTVPANAANPLSIKDKSSFGGIDKVTFIELGVFRKDKIANSASVVYPFRIDLTVTDGTDDTAGGIYQRNSSGDFVAVDPSFDSYKALKKIRKRLRTSVADLVVKVSPGVESGNAKVLKISYARIILVGGSSIDIAQSSDKSTSDLFFKIDAVKSSLFTYDLGSGLTVKSVSSAAK